MPTDRNDALFPSFDRRLELTTRLDERLNAVLSEIAAGPVSPTLDIPRFRRQLAAIDFATPQDIESVSDWLIENMRVGQVHMTHPRYFGLFNPAPTFPSEYADRISAAYNPQICVWSHAPAAVEVEAHVIRQLASRLGLPEASGGHFTSGGSEANHTAVICALTRALPDFTRLGARAFTGQPRVYASKESHLAWLKIAHESGIGRDAIVLIDTDGAGRMNANALQDALEADVDTGNCPVMIAATAGTTNAGMIDPLRECAELAREFRVWLHVDAAWGGALAASERLRTELDGIGRADSVTIDAHKWFAATMGTGMFLTAHPPVLADAFHVSTSYMPSNDQSVDLYVNSMQWSRRFIGVRLFLALATVGWDGFAEHVERGVALIDRLNASMLGAGWRVANDARTAVSCLVPPVGARDVASIVATLVESNNHWVSMTRFEDEPVIRACITNGRTTENDVDSLSAALVHAAKS